MNQNTFFLRQTVPFFISDFFKVLKIFFQPIDLKKKTKEVENIIKKNIDSKYCLLSSSMRSGLIFVLKYFKEVKPNKKTILLPEYSFHSNLSSALKLGYKVKFVGVDKKTLNIDPKKLEKAIDENTLGVIITHMHGIACEMDEIAEIARKKKILIFEDCAHSYKVKYKGKAVGSFGIGIFSFGPGKNMTAFGGGAVTTSDKNLYEYLRKNSVYAESSFVDNFIILLKFFIYTLITNKYFSFLFMKPLFGYKYSKGNFSGSHEPYDASLYVPSKIVKPIDFKIKLLDWQTTELNQRINELIMKRNKVGLSFNKIHKVKLKDGDIYFQYPLPVKNKKSFIKKYWNNNIDVQEDYCSYLPLMVKNGIDLDKKKYFNSIVYLPTNYQMVEKI